MPQKFEITYPVNIYNRVVELTANNTWKERRFPLSIQHTGVPCTAGCPTIKSGKTVLNKALDNQFRGWRRSRLII